MRQATITLAVTAAMLTGCAAPTPQANPPAAPRPLRVAAASSLKGAFEKLAAAFEDSSGSKVVFDFGASGILQKQIEGGAPVDVFASASPKQIDALIADGLVSADSTVTFAGNDLVIFVPKGNPSAVTGPETLARAHRLTTGDPVAAPHGAKAQEWLITLDLWEKLRSRFVFTQNAAQTLDYVARGEVDAGIGFASEVNGRADVVAVYTVPRGAIEPVRYVVAPIEAASQPAVAARFVDYLLSSEGQAVLREAGFLSAPAK